MEFKASGPMPEKSPIRRAIQSHGDRRHASHGKPGQTTRMPNHRQPSLHAFHTRLPNRRPQNSLPPQLACDSRFHSYPMKQFSKAARKFGLILIAPPTPVQHFFQPILPLPQTPHNPPELNSPHIKHIDHRTHALHPSHNPCSNTS